MKVPEIKGMTQLMMKEENMKLRQEKLLLGTNRIFFV